MSYRKPAHANPFVLLLASIAQGAVVKLSKLRPRHSAEAIAAAVAASGQPAGG
jgi:hypothetical protein